MDKKNIDIIIAGAGPAGCACAISLAATGLQVALVDKAVFPRDKTCGDALSIDVVNQLALISPTLAEEFKMLQNKMPSYGIKVFSADHSSIAIPLLYKNEKACGYVSPRRSFDDLLFQHTKHYSNIHCYENTVIENIEHIKDAVLFTAKDIQLQAPMIIGADGAHSIVAKQLANAHVDKDHYSGGLRVYYENVTGFEENNLIELHFFKDIIPGYLWLFPMADNKANVGIGMLSSAIAKNKVNLKDELKKLLTTHPVLKERFKNAKALETVKGYGLPLGSKKRNISGQNFLLVGDAAGLIDPFTGEGIANAIRSGRIAAKHFIGAYKSNDFSASFNKKYDKEIYDKMWKEFRISGMLQRLAMHPRLCNLIVKKANSVKYIQQLLMQALASVDKRKSILINPKFYFKLFFSKKQKAA